MLAVLPQNVKNELLRKQREKNVNKMKKILKWNDKHTYDKKRGHDGVTNHLMVDSFEDIPGYLKRTSSRSSRSVNDFAWAGLLMKYKKIVGELILFFFYVYLSFCFVWRKNDLTTIPEKKSTIFSVLD